MKNLKCVLSDRNLSENAMYYIIIAILIKVKSIELMKRLVLTKGCWGRREIGRVQGNIKSLKTILQYAVNIDTCQMWRPTDRISSMMFPNNVMDFR